MADLKKPALASKTSSLFESDSLIPESIAAIVLFGAIVFLLLLAPLFSANQATPGNATVQISTGIVQPTETVRIKSQYVLYGEGAVVLLGVFLIIHGLFFAQYNWDTIKDRNTGVQRVVKGLACILGAIIFNIVYTLFL